MIIEDIRRFVFPLLSAEVKDGVVQVETIAFHGTAFFVTASGLALSARHIVPDATTLGTRQLFAGVQRDGFQFFLVKDIQAWGVHDFCTIHVAIDKAQHFACSFKELNPGQDVQSIGIPDHSPWDKSKKQIRILKGHVAYATSTLLELSFPVPKGMRGSPLLVEDKAVGVLIGNWRSEQMEDRLEEIVEVSDRKEVIRFVESKEIINSGVAVEFALLKDLPAYIEKHK